MLSRNTKQSTDFNLLMQEKSCWMQKKLERLKFKSQKEKLENQ